MVVKNDEVPTAESVELGDAGQTKLVEYLGLSREAVPDGDGTMPLAAAVRWIACEGRQRQFAANDPVWHSAIRELVDNIASSNCVVSGVKKGVSTRIKNERFANIDFQWAHDGEGNDLQYQQTDGGYPREYLFVFAAPDPKLWKAWWNDKLYQGPQLRVDKIELRRVDVRKRWPFSVDEAVASFAGPKPPANEMRPMSPAEVETAFAKHRRALADRGRRSTRKQDRAFLKGLNKETAESQVASIRDKHAAPQTTMPPLAQAKKRGPKGTYKWEQLRPFIYDLLAKHGVPGESAKPDWTKTRYVEEALIWCASRAGFGREPSRSMADKIVAKFISEYGREREASAAE